MYVCMFVCVSVCVFCPYQDIVKEYIEKLSHDQLPALMDFLRQLLLKKGSKPVVVYGHCEVSGVWCGKCMGVYMRVRTHVFMCINVLVCLCMCAFVNVYPYVHVHAANTFVCGVLYTVI